MTEQPETSDEEPTPEETALILSTALEAVGSGDYSAIDKYRDFRRVFLDSIEGKRVLHQILAWGHMARPSFGAGGAVDPYRIAIHEGERHMALRILGTIAKEPTEQPKQTNQRKEQ